MSVVALGAAGIGGSVLAAETDPGKPKVYVCAPCGCAADGKEFPAPGQCPECGMPLIEKPAAPPKLSAQDRAAPAKASSTAWAKPAVRLTT